MNILLICLNAVLPSFLMMLAGHGARCAGIIRGEDVPRFNRVAFCVFLPVMLFYNIYSSDISSAVRPGLLAYAVLSVFIIFALSVAYALLFVKQPEKRGVFIQGLYRSNFVLLGLPVASALVENGDLSLVAVLVGVIVPIYNLLAVFCLEIFGGKKAKASEIAINIAKNPLIIASMLGLIFAALGITLPKPVDAMLHSFAAVGSPLALFLLGAFFRFESVDRNIKDIAKICLGRLVIIPAVFLGIAYALGFRGMDFAGLMSMFASATAVSSFTMTQQMGGDSELAGNIVVVTSLLCSFTMYFWSVIFKSLGAF